jgi:hypothetical protein
LFFGSCIVYVWFTWPCDYGVFITWVGISIDFVLGFSRSERDRDYIFIIMNMFFKLIHFISYHKIDDATNITDLFFREIYQISMVLMLLLIYIYIYIYIFYLSLFDIGDDLWMNPFEKIKRRWYDQDHTKRSTASFNWAN